MAFSQCKKCLFFQWNWDGSQGVLIAEDAVTHDPILRVPNFHLSIYVFAGRHDNEAWWDGLYLPHPQDSYIYLLFYMHQTEMRNWISFSPMLGLGIFVSFSFMQWIIYFIKKNHPKKNVVMYYSIICSL